MMFIGGLFLADTFLSEAKPADLPEQIRQIIEERFSDYPQGGIVTVGKERIHFTDQLRQFYDARHFNGIWIHKKGLLPIADELMSSIDAASIEGLKPSDYHINKIRTLLMMLTKRKAFRKLNDSAILADLELLLSDAFLLYGTHLLSGRVNPETIDPEWITNRRDTDLLKILNQAIITKQITDTLNFLLPPQVEYFRLKKALQKYRSIVEAGGWPSLPEANGTVLKIGTKSSEVATLRHRLVLTGDLPGNKLNPEGRLLFDEDLAAAVSRFQIRQGLPVNGLVDQNTREALNIPVKERITQLIINLERWRWLPQDLGNPHILVNIPNFELNLVKDSTTVLNSRVIVGKSYRKTPVFSNMMTFLIVNPFWYIPANIAIDDILPLVKKNTAYLKKRQIRVYNSWKENDIELDPHAINWKSITEDNFQFLFVQDPGPYNALGAFKFMFPNSFDVYLHDTLNKELFQESSREFSSGCIRVENSFELAVYLLKDNKNWDRNRLKETIAARTPTRIDLARPTAVHLLYWTAWVDNQNGVHFRKDIYQRDLLLAKALSEN